MDQLEELSQYLSGTHVVENHGTHLCVCDAMIEMFPPKHCYDDTKRKLRATSRPWRYGVSGIVHMVGTAGVLDTMSEVDAWLRGTLLPHKTMG